MSIPRRSDAKSGCIRDNFCECPAKGQEDLRPSMPSDVHALELQFCCTSALPLMSQDAHQEQRRDRRCWTLSSPQMLDRVCRQSELYAACNRTRLTRLSRLSQRRCSTETPRQAATSRSWQAAPCGAAAGGPAARVGPPASAPMPAPSRNTPPYPAQIMPWAQCPPQDDSVCIMMMLGEAANATPVLL